MLVRRNEFLKGLEKIPIGADWDYFDEYFYQGKAIGVWLPQ
jgi:hypothetical protein